MALVKSGQIVNCCQPNALMTLQEYLCDYATEDTIKKGELIIKEELKHITNEKVLSRATSYLEEVKKGNRDFRF